MLAFPFSAHLFAVLLFISGDATQICEINTLASSFFQPVTRDNILLHRIAESRSYVGCFSLIFHLLMTDGQLFGNNSRNDEDHMPDKPL